MTIARADRTWWGALFLACVLVAVFVVLVVVSVTLRRYWPLLAVSAVVAAAPFLLWPGPDRRPSRALPVTGGPGSEGRTDDGAVALRAAVVTVAKASASAGENEDAAALDADGGYVAVADGASSSFRAAEWARALCDTFVARRPLDGGADTSWITAAAEAFARNPTSAATPDAGWWNADAAQRGAQAAFVGLAVLRTADGLVWRASAVGDSVLVHLRRDGDRPPVVTAFPVPHSAAFPASPVLLSSVDRGRPPVAWIDGPAEVGDRWLVMTDELARWALARHEAGDPVWSVLSTGSPADVRALVAVARADAGVADDDMTVVQCETVAGPGR